jgi:hypothetical protein
MGEEEGWLPLISGLTPAGSSEAIGQVLSWIDLLL